MSWKCVLVGLALVLPGTLLSVEGKYTEESRDNQDGQYLARLLNYFQQDRLLTEKAHLKHKEIVPEKKSGNTGLHQSKDTLPNDSGPPARVDSLPDTGLNLARASPLQQHEQHRQHGKGKTIVNSMTFIMLVAGCTVLAAVGIIGAGVCWYKYNRGVKAASDVEYPAYGVTGPTKDRLPSPGDRKLAQSAQMYHYQHQKQQMIAMEKANGDMKHDASDDESEEDNVEGDYTVYECPGLAPTGEMEVKNPLFRGDETPSTPANGDSHEPSGDQ